MWDQLAPLYKDVRRLQARAELEAQALRRELDGLLSKPVKERRSRLSELEGAELHTVFDNLQRDNRALIQFQALRLWHLTASGDPGLSAYVAELRAELSTQGELVDGLYEAVKDAVEAAGGSSRFETVLSPFDSRQVRGRTARLLEQLSEMKAGYRPLQLATTKPQPLGLSSPPSKELVAD
jgi:hypothetical protein